VSTPVTLVRLLGAYALIPLRWEFIAAGGQGSSISPPMANLYFHGIDRRGYYLHMFFFCLGAALWYSLLLASGAVPKALAIWGVAAIGLLTIPMFMMLYDRQLKSPMFLGIAYLPCEKVLGIWLLVKGFQ